MVLLKMSLFPQEDIKTSASFPLRTFKPYIYQFQPGKKIPFNYLFLLVCFTFTEADIIGFVLHLLVILLKMFHQEGNG